MRLTNYFAGAKDVINRYLLLFSESVLQEPFEAATRTERMSNLKKNWYFPISAAAFFCLSAALNVGYILGIPIAFAAAMVIASLVPSLWSMARKNTLWLQLFSFISAIGICLSAQASFYRDLMESSKTQVLRTLFPAAAIDIPAVLTGFAAIVSFFFVYYALLIFWRTVIRLFSDSGIFSGLHTCEWVIYTILVVGALVFMACCFTRTEAFYENGCAQNIIYTSDTRMLVKWNAYMTLTHQENDLRQPLFAVFSAPFTALPYLISRLTGASTSVHGMLMNSAQIIMLFLSNLMIAGMMNLSRLKRICFMVVTSFTYTQLLFILMMEQYIVACFWLILFIYLIVKDQKPRRIALWGTGGTLLTGMVLLPLMSKESPFKNFRLWISDMLKYGFEFVALLLVFCRFDVIFNLFSRIVYLSRFTGKSVTFAEKFYQYTHFIHDCLFAPNAGIFTDSKGHTSWQLADAASVNYIGLAIILLVIVSAFLNRDKKSSRLAAVWITFSVVLLLGLGWGTGENGLILYSLYFGWAFFMLLFQLVEKIEHKLGIHFLIPAATIGASVIMLFVNIPGITDMVSFAIDYFPV